MTVMTKAIPIDLSIVIPVYKSQQTLPVLHQRIADVLGKDAHWELILVDDASPDDTRQIAESIASQDKRVVYHRLESNRGQHYATIYGLRHSSGAKIVTMDDDLEHAPEYIPKLIEPLNDGFLVVIARFQNKTHSRIRRAGSWLMGCLWRQFYGADGLAISSFKAFERSALDCLLARSDITVSPFSAHILKTLPRNSLTNIVVEHHPRFHGKSNYNGFMLLCESSKIVWGAYRRVSAKNADLIRSPENHR